MGLADIVVLVQILQMQRTVIFDFTIGNIARQAASLTQRGIVYLCIDHTALQMLPCLINPAALRDVESYRFESRMKDRRLVVGGSQQGGSSCAE